MKALFIWKVNPELREFLERGTVQCGNLELIFLEDPESEVEGYLSEADVMIGWRPKDGWLEQASKLKTFINPGAGIQHHLERFRALNKERTIQLVNGHGNAYFTAQHTVSMLLALHNQLVPHHNWLKDGKWRLGDKEAASLPLRDRAIGLLGYGHINRLVHRFLTGFDLRFNVLTRSEKINLENVAEFQF